MLDHGGDAPLLVSEFDNQILSRISTAFNPPPQCSAHTPLSTIAHARMRKGKPEFRELLPNGKKKAGRAYSLPTFGMDRLKETLILPLRSKRDLRLECGR
jgi:hypothetical protein